MQGLTGARLAITHYDPHKKAQLPQSISQAARAIKAKRQAVLERVRKQQAQVHKTVQDWMDEGLVIPASKLKGRYSVEPSSSRRRTLSD
jgi:predicted esterase YcpF (UPF0227 family)